METLTAQARRPSSDIGLRRASEAVLVGLQAPEAASIVGIQLVERVSAGDAGSGWPFEPPAAPLPVPSVTQPQYTGR